jgi:hypothetical protein
MISAFLSLLACLLSFQLFTITSKLTAMNRIVISTPIALLEASIPLVGDEDIISPYFDRQILENTLDSYYKNELAQYYRDISIDYYYYHQEDKSFCMEEKCDAVEVTISTRIIFNFRYSRVMFYQIKDMQHGH